MARFLLSALVATTLVFSAEITKAPALGAQHQVFIQPEQSLQNHRLEKRSESGQRTRAIREKRFALVIGNGEYAGANPLRNPPNDARAMSTALREIGFDVVERVDLNSWEMKKSIIDFGDKLRSNDVGLFYYAGHGVQSNGKNYLIPVDAEIEKEADIGVDGIDLDTVLGQIESANNRLNIVILDACRNDFSTRNWRSQGRGLLQISNAPSGTFIAYATAPGATASDNKSGQNGLYTQELLIALRRPGLRIEEVFKQVRLRVKELSDGKQVPWESSSLEGEFYFIPTNSTVASSNLSRPSGGRPDNSPTTLAPNSDTLKNKQNNAGNPDSNLIQPTIKIDRSRNSIQRKIDAGLYDDAIREGLDYLESLPDDMQVNWLLGLVHAKKLLFPGGFRYISKAVESGMPVTFDIQETDTSFTGNIKQGTLKVQKDGIEIQLDKTTTKVPYNLVRDISAVLANSTTEIRLKAGVSQNNKLKEKEFKLYILFFRDYPLTADDVALSGAFRIWREVPIHIHRSMWSPQYQIPKIDNDNAGIIDGWARNVVNFITDLKTKAQ